MRVPPWKCVPVAIAISAPGAFLSSLLSLGSRSAQHSRIHLLLELHGQPPSGRLFFFLHPPPLLLVERVKSVGKVARNLRIALFKFYSKRSPRSIKGINTENESRFTVALSRWGSFGRGIAKKQCLPFAVKERKIRPRTCILQWRRAVDVVPLQKLSLLVEAEPDDRLQSTMRDRADEVQIAITIPTVNNRNFAILPILNFQSRPAASCVDSTIYWWRSYWRNDFNIFYDKQGRTRCVFSN